jgi:hypothetical protein
MWSRAILAAAVLAGTAGTGNAGEDPWVVYEGGEGPGAGVHVVLVAGDEEYRSEEALPMLGKILAVRHGFRCTVLFSVNPRTGEIDPDESANVPGLAALDDADVLVMFWRFRRLADQDMAHVVAYVEAGKPLLGIRTATHAFSYEEDSSSPYAHWSWRNDRWPEGFGRQVLGETWVAHHGLHGSESTRGVVPVAARRHPILRGVEDVWGPTDVYAIRDLPLDSFVLLEGSVRAGMEPDAPAVEGAKNEPRMPIVWCRERALPGLRPDQPKQRVMCSTIGASVDLESEDLRRLFVNGVFWLAGREGRIPERADVSLVGSYAPTPFGFGGGTKGVRPSDHVLKD